jgi:hypothetical protein
MGRGLHGSPGDAQHRPVTRVLLIAPFDNGLAVARPAWAHALLTMKVY